MAGHRRGDDGNGRQLAAVRRRAEELNALREPSIRNYLWMIENGHVDQGFVNNLSYMLDRFEEQQRHAPNFLEPAPETADELNGPNNAPDFVIGRTTENGLDFGPSIARDCGSVLVTGIPGGGKTTLVLQMILGVHRSVPGAATIIFDVKGDFQCLASLGHPNVHVHKLRDLRLNLLRPPLDVPIGDWLAILATYIIEYRGLKKSRHVLLDAMKQLCRHFGVDKDPRRPWPSLWNVLDYIKRMPGAAFGKHADYKSSLVNELQGLLDDTGDVLNTCDGIGIERDMLTAGGIFVIGMETTPVPAQQLLISLLIEHVIAARIARNVHNRPMEVMVVLDEAQLVLSRASDQASANGIAPLAQQLLRGRELGVAFIVVAHLLTDISRAVCASAKTKFLVGGLSDHTSINIAVDLLNLPPRAKPMIHRLGRGKAIVQAMGLGGPYADAFLLDIHPPPITKNAVDEPTRRQLMAAKLAAFPASPSKRLEDYPAVMQAIGSRKPSKKPAAKAKPSAPAGLKPEELDILRDGIRNRDDFMEERRDRMGITDHNAFSRRCKHLESAGLLRVHAVRLGRKNYTFIEVTDQGFHVANQGKRPPHYIGHGGFLHTVIIARVQRTLKAWGWSDVKAEKPIGTHRHAVDVFGVSPQGLRVGFEITLSTSNVCSNAIKSLTTPGAGDELMFLCKLDRDCRAVEKQLRREPSLTPYLSRIRVERIDGYLS